ncbi:MAG: hypothetical protein LBJ46_06925 [Planctomycetota bacterium]|jgi:flagellin|nr:hypothetical protein [Planctomycetota bacterium]
MSLIINHNLSAMQSHRNLGFSNSGMTKSIEKLSSGYQINVGADDPSGLIISEQLRSQISGLERAVRNSSEAYNLIGIAEGALNEMNEILKKLRALSIHAANNGITSPEQVAADQAEMDSGIQTLDRIANTTRYSDQYLLNGSKQLVYEQNTVVDEPTDHKMLDTKMTRIDQVFKRSGYKMSIGFTGQLSEWQANSKTSAQRAYLETDPNNPLCEVKDGKITVTQEFILTGTKGSRLFNFAAGTNLGTMVESINNVKDSTGVGASLIFGSDARIDLTTNGSLTPPVYPDTRACAVTGYSDGTYVYKTGDVQIYGAGLNNKSTSAISEFTMTPDAAEAFRVGYNCDGDGKIYARITDKSTNSIEYFKDRECTMLIGKGTDQFFAAANNSGIPSSPASNLDGIFIELTDKAENLDVFEIAVVGQRMDNQKDFTVGGVGGWADVGNAVMSGVNLGTNTSPEGQIFYKYTPLTYESDGTTVKTFKIEAFSNSTMEPRYLVASSGSAEAAVNANGQTVRIESVRMANGHDSGLNITLNVPAPNLVAQVPPGAPINSALPTGEEEGTVTFTNIGARLYATDYGSQQTIRMQNNEGNLFYYYRESDTLEKVHVTSGDTIQIAGQDARIGLNGAEVLTNGLVANTTTPDFSGALVFNGGKLGLATIAQAGHEYGSLYSRATAIQAIEENEVTIEEERRRFEPPSLLYNTGSSGALGINDSNGKPIQLYLDFSQIDPTVEAKIDKLDTLSAIDVEFDGTNIIIKADSLNQISGVIADVSIPIDSKNLTGGFYITDPNLKGVFIRTSGVINSGRSTVGTETLDITAYGGSELMEVHTYATNPRKNTSEDLFNFLGGMQYQLGNTEGDQDRTVYSIQSMVMANVGRMTWEGEEYCLQDVLGGGVASLSRDPILAMRIVSQAVDDVSTLRARLGAFQKNMLQTNINSLNVAIENITKTESAIRDTDMAKESTEFTRNQIMVQAGTSMLAQANQVTQNVLSLLGR